MARLQLWRTLAATLLLIAVLVILRAPIGNAARQDETGRPSSCDGTMTGGGMGRDDSHRGTPGTMMDDDDSHMNGRDGDMTCDDPHRGSPITGDDRRDMMGSPVTGMGPGSDRMGTPGAHMDCANRDGTPSARMGCDGMNGTHTVGRDCDGMDRDSDCGRAHDDGAAGA